MKIKTEIEDEKKLYTCKVLIQIAVVGLAPVNDKEPICLRQ